MNEPNEQTGGSEVRATRNASRRRRAVFVSIVFHLALLTALFFWVFPPSSTTPVADTDASTAKPVPSSSPDTPPPQSTPAMPAPVADVPPEQIKASIDSQIRQVQNLTDEQKLTELDKNLRRLESISSEASVQEVTATIADSLGLKPGAEPAQQQVAGSFDHDSAQLHDVSRRRGDSGSWQYECILVDAQGRTQSVPMTESEGEPIYQAFEKMKEFPMAAGIYRQVVMPMIQKLIEAGEVAQQAASAQSAPGQTLQTTED